MLLPACSHTSWEKVLGDKPESFLNLSLLMSFYKALTDG